MPQTIILLCSPTRVDQLASWVDHAAEVLAPYRLLTTTELAEALRTRCPHEIIAVLSTQNGGEIQLAGLIPSHSILATVFLRDPHAANAAPLFDPFAYASDLNGVPLATNMGSALALIPWLNVMASGQGSEISMTSAQRSHS